MDNSPEAVKGRVRSMTKAIRYKARKEGNLMKAFNDYMGSASLVSVPLKDLLSKVHLVYLRTSGDLQCLIGDQNLLKLLQ